MKIRELKIYYKADGINSEFDKKIKTFLSDEFDLNNWASGIDTQTNVRDLAFSRADKKE